jgi:predicted GH43/DUF377 family glycosyl hydrolase
MGIVKYKNNPIITRENVSLKVNSIFNPGAVKWRDKYLLICRVELPSGKSSFILAESKNGIEFKVCDNFLLHPEHHNNNYKYSKWGIEDPRVTKIDEKFYLSYTGYSEYMPLVILSETEDFKSFNIIGPISEPSNKDCALFPERISGFYWKVDRPTANDRNDIWISKSPDLIHWGGYQVLMQPEQGTWEANKIGNSGPPIKTKEGWLMLYHGVRGFGISSIYRIGVVLLDLEKPWIVKGKSVEPILSPEEPYERIGDVGNVVFTNGCIVEDNGEVKIYYSGADTNICLATTTISYLLSQCKPLK